MASLTASERDDPPVRRKSCEACKKSRRRCDQARPTCQRCSQRRIECRYPQARARTCTPASAPVAEDTGLGSFDPSCFDMIDDILPTDDFTDSLYQESLAIESLPNFSTNDSLSSFGQESRLSLTAQDALKSSQLVAAPRVGRVLTSRLQYAMDKIMTAPSRMVSMNKMPWCHARLYDEGMPRSMQRMFSSLSSIF